MTICDIRGWGYLTGVGGLKLSETEAIAVQVANSAFIGHARTDIPALLDDLDAQDAEVARLTDANDRLIATVRADEWQARYWTEHDAVGDRDATIMANAADTAAMRRALERISKAVYIRTSDEARRALADCVQIADAALQSGAGAKLLAEHATELKNWWSRTRTMVADLAAAIARKDRDSVALRDALRPLAALAQPKAGDIDYAWSGTIPMALLRDAAKALQPGRDGSNT